MHTIRSPEAVVAEDSDVFQLLLHHADPAASNVYIVAANRTVCGDSEEICCPGRKCCNLYGERVFKSGPGKSRRKGPTYHV